jgi:signal transduction histidine kinase
VGTRVQIEIGDTGCGIAAGDLDKVFSPDFSTKPVGKGTGLGLASVNTMVKAYSGNIIIKSEPGQGTRVTVSLPAVAKRVRQVSPIVA